MANEIIKLISGFEIINKTKGKDSTTNRVISKDDIELTEKIFSLGSDKSSMSNEIRELYHKHMNPNFHFCNGCLGSMYVAWERYYNTYLRFVNEYPELNKFRNEVIERIIIEKY